MSDASSDQDPIAPLRAALAGRYDIERELGSGAFATVYLAHDLRHDRRVAIKVLNVDPRSEVPELRFLREIRLLARLQHPNILPLHDSGHVLDRLYYVMPYIGGESLRDRLGRERRMEVVAALRIGREVADALAYAHRAGVIHRDIKPENILLSGAHPIVADFGIARVADGARARLTGTGFGSPGTPAYMSPEQLLGGTELDARSDIYSLGCVVYEMLAGEPPFSGPSGFARRFTEAPPSVAKLRRDVPTHVDAAIQRAMARLPEERYATADELADALAAEARPEARPVATRTASAPAPVPEAPGIRRYAPIPLEEAPSPTPPAVANAGVPAPQSDEPARDGPPSLVRRAAMRWQPIALVLFAMVLFSGAMWVVRSEGTADPSPRRVVVTPLANHTGSPRFDAVGLMVADWITGGLQGMSSLEVVPTPTALETFRAASRAGRAGAQDPVRFVADETGADFIVAGALYQSAERLLFRLHVTDVREQQVVETLPEIAAPADDPIAGVEAARARLMGWFAGQEDERVRSEMAESVSPPTYAAYVAFSEGLDHYLDAEFGQALPRFLAAHAADTSFVASLLYASLCLSNQGEYARSDSVLAIADRSRASLSRYQRAWLDYRKAFLAGQHERALVAVREAARLAPDSKASYNHAVAAFQTGRASEALEVLTSIPQERGPMRGFLPYWDLLGAVNHALERFGEERAVGDSARRLYPARLVAFMPLVRSFAARGQIDSLERALSEAASFPRDPIGPDYGELLQEAAEELRAHGHGEASRRTYERAYSWYRSSNRGAADRWALARVSYALGWYDEAESFLGTVRRSGERPEHVGLLALVYARSGRRTAALALADTIEAMRQPYQYGVPSLYQARLAAMLDDRQRAVAKLREAIAQGHVHDLWLHRDVDLASLRGDRPYDEVAKAKP